VSTTTVVAIYAAGVGTASLGWSVYAWRTARRERVRVALSRMHWSEDVPLLVLHIDNLGERDLRLGLAAIAWGSNPRRSALIHGSEAFEEVAERQRGKAPFLIAREELPEIVPAHDWVTVGFMRDSIDIAGLELDDPDIVAEVHVGRRTYRAHGIPVQLR
jgi:hypothetical protein